MIANRLILVVASVALLAHAEQTELPRRDEIPQLASSRIDKNENIVASREGRMALHPEAASSKAKREQALKSILATRRRQLLASRGAESRKSSRRGPDASVETADMLEAQETRHGVYVTAPIAEQISVTARNAEDSSARSKETSSPVSRVNPEKARRVSEKMDDSTRNSLLARGSEERVSQSANEAGKNASIARGQKISDSDNRRKINTVAMPESLYNHFRPVESNIPIEDMSQFLYFGQKLNLEGTNSSSRNNNSLEGTSSTSSSVASSRRRNSVRRAGTTSPVARLEEIMNEEMNIALERSTIERNKIPRSKSVFRSPGSVVYFRQSPVYAEAETPRNSSEKQREPARDPSAHATRDQVPETDGSDFHSEPIAAAASAHRARNITHPDNHSTQLREKAARRESEREGTGRKSNPRQSSASSEMREKSTSPEDKVQITPTSRNELYDKITTWQSVHSARDSTTFSASLESDNGMSLSTSDDLAASPEVSSIPPAATTSPTSTSLRIVVTEPASYEGETGINGGRIGKEEERRLKFSSDPGETSKKTSGEPAEDTEGVSVKTEVNDDRVSGATEAIESSSEPGRAEYKEHAYAYEITNVTRLLRNYTGPGLNVERGGGRRSGESADGTEEKGPAGGEVEATATTLTRSNAGSIQPEIRNGSAEPTPPSQQLPLLLLLPTPRRETTERARGAQPARTAGQLSAGADLGEATPSALDAFNERTENPGITEHPVASPTLSNTTESFAASALPDRQNDYTRSIDIDETAVNKFTNFTSNSSTNVEDKTVRVYAQEFKNFTSNSSKNVDDIIVKVFESTTASKIEEDHFSLVDGKIVKGYDYSSSLSPKIEQVSKESKRRRLPASSFSSNRRIKSSRIADEKKISGSRSMEDRTSSVREHARVEGMKNESDVDSMTGTNLFDTTTGMEINLETGTTVVPPSTLDSPLKIRTDLPIVATEVRETVAPSTTTEMSSVRVEKSTTTTRSAPVFPVTPKMMESPRQAPEKKSSNESRSDPDRPFGLAQDLDPSEIQKMYRSQTSPKPETTTTTTTILSEDKSTEKIEGSSQDFPRAENSSAARSPEVRGRNLADKAANKDDILPIMQLYNTSTIFNGTGADFAVDSVKPIVQENTNATSNSTRASEKRERVPESKKNSPSHENHNSTHHNRTRYPPNYHQTTEFIGYHPEFNSSFFEPGMISVSPREPINLSEVITKRHDGDAIASQETVAVVSYILATLVVFPIAVGVGLILRRLIIRNRKVLEESDTSSEISCRKDALNLENGDFKSSIEKAITKLPRIQHLCHEAEKPPPPTSQESRWEFPRDKLRLQTVLGQGNFGQVWKAEADDLTGHQGTTRLVAVKTVKEGASPREKEDLIRELEIMQQLGNHPNVVTLLGCCTEEEPHYLILEYVMYGKLLAYLRDHRTRQDFYNFSEDSAALTSRDLTVFGYCVARGMEYLASKKIIHRDLAARNVLVDHNKLCKIADFGMSRFANEEGEIIEARHGRNALPIRWMAPESLIYSLFTTKTDVWSFGILMWEIVTLGSTPYPDMAAREVMRNVQNGYRLERPSHCRSELFRVISRCWNADPDRRPEFQTLRRDMAQLLEDGLNGHYVDLESFASECTD